MIEYIKYKKEKLPIRISYTALKHLKTELGKDLSSINEGDLAMYETLLFYGLKSGFRAEEKKFELTMEDMEDVLDECFTEFIEIMPRFFSKLVGVGGQTEKVIKQARK